MARRATRPAVKVAPPSPAQIRAAARSVKSVAPHTAAARKLELDGLSADQKIVVLLRDRDKLLGQLAASQAKILALEAREDQLADRIAWALDTLNDLLREAG